MPAYPFIINDPLNDPTTARQLTDSLRLSADDNARASSVAVTMVALAPFTIVQDGNQGGNLYVGGPTVELVIRAGDEFQITEFDVPKYRGKARRKVTP